MTPDERFMAKVDQMQDGCWLWTGAVNHHGYGNFRVGGRGSSPVRAHRWSFERSVGPIPDGLEIDHLCRVRRCVNPEHLEAVTRAENQRRRPDGGVGRAWREIVAKKTECKQGHPWIAQNIYVSPAGQRACRVCAKIRNQNRRRKP